MVHPSARHCYCRESFPKSAKISGPGSGRFIFTLYEILRIQHAYVNLVMLLGYNIQCAESNYASGLSHDLARSRFGACSPGESLTFDTSKYDVGILWGFLCFLYRTADSESGFLSSLCVYKRRYNIFKITPPQTINIQTIKVYLLHFENSVLLVLSPTGNHISSCPVFMVTLFGACWIWSVIKIQQESSGDWTQMIVKL